MYLTANGSMNLEFKLHNLFSTLCPLGLSFVCWIEGYRCKSLKLDHTN